MIWSLIKSGFIKIQHYIGLESESSCSTGRGLETFNTMNTQFTPGQTLPTEVFMSMYKINMM